MKKIYFLLIFFFALFFYPFRSQAITVKILSLENFETLFAFKPISEEKVKGYNIAVGDLRNDSNIEIVLGPVYLDKNPIEIYDYNGKFVNSFYPYGENFQSGVSMAIGDVNGDKREELVVVPGRGSECVVKFFDLNANEIFKSFTAFNNTNGCRIAVLDVDGDAKKELAISNVVDNWGTVRIYDYTGKLLRTITYGLTNSLYALNLTAIDLSGDGYDELAVSSEYGGNTKVKYYLAGGRFLDEKLLYNPKVHSGLSLASAKISKEEKGESLVVAPLFTAGPYIKIFDSYLQFEKGKFTDNYKRDYGLNIASADWNKDGLDDLFIVKANSKAIENRPGHYIDINVSTQRFAYYDNGYLLANVLTSTGKPSTPTKLGEFKVLSKYKVAYGGIPGQKWVMPYWVGFYKVGAIQNGIHAMPYVNGVKESHRDLGKAVSHGCVRLADWEIKRFYNWVQIGDTIVVHK